MQATPYLGPPPERSSSGGVATPYLSPGASSDPVSTAADHRTVFTIGHSTRPANVFVDLLRAHSVRMVVDVRRYPGSRRNPQYNRETLSGILAAAGLEYVHVPALGGRRGAPDPDSPNTAWRVPGFRAYADRMADETWQEALAALETRALAETVAYMCAEAVPWRCHRRLISDALTARGWEVRHILERGRADRHRMHPAARILSDGRIVYPGPETEQRRLL